VLFRACAGLNRRTRTTAKPASVLTGVCRYLDTNYNVVTLDE